MREQNLSAILNQNFIQRVERDMENHDILYIFAPLGWEKEVIMKRLYDDMASQDSHIWGNYDEYSQEQQILKILIGKRCIYLVLNPETAVEVGEQNPLWGLLANKKPEDVFVLASSTPVPAGLIPYTILSRFVGYEIKDIKPEQEAVAAYFKARGIILSKEELSQIERDCDFMPLYLQLLANLLVSTGRSYSNAMKERCFEDLFSYMDVVFFRRFSEYDQDAMLKLSCLERFDNQLISYMLGVSRKEAESLVERLMMKGSVLLKEGNNWKFFRFMKLFLERSVHKYLTYEERVEEYQKALGYLTRHEKWLPALKFAYILQDKEEMARCLSVLLQEQAAFGNAVMLEEYFRELSVDILMQYPNLLLAGSILKANSGDVKAALRYEKLYRSLIDQTDHPEERQRLQAQLLVMYMSRPGMLEDDILKVGTELLEILRDSAVFAESQMFEPNYISVLRGEKDYCRYFKKNPVNAKVLGNLREAAAKMEDPTFSILIRFMEAEVLYERNELDQALDLLVKITRDAKICGNQNLQQLCTFAMMDLLAAKNQMNSAELFQLDQKQHEKKALSMFWENCRAHTIFYYLLKGRTDSVAEWMERYAPDENDRFYASRYYQYLIKAKAYISMEQYVRARMILQVLFEYAVQYKMSYLEAQVRILEAFIYYKEGSPLWRDTILPTLQWGKDLGFIRVFADEGAAVYEVLNKLSQVNGEWGQDDYFKKVLNAAKAQMLQYPKYLKQEKKGKVDDFSESERSVMKLLVLGEKNAEIAKRLCVSENTVKYHLKNIYQKLQVKNRSQAIHKIREYEII